MSTSESRKGSGTPNERSRALVYLFLGALTLGAGGCPVSSPVAPQDPCPGGIVCNSPSIPGDFQCLANIAVDCQGNSYTDVSVAYMCAYGADRNPAGLFTSLECAKWACQAVPPVGIVRCTP